MIVIEGHYSMDGDIPDLPAFSALARRMGAWLLVDEAHSLGVVEPRVAVSPNISACPPNAADFWMGTLSKTLSGCGGYIAGRETDRISENLSPRLCLFGRHAAARRRPPPSPRWTSWRAEPERVRQAERQYPPIDGGNRKIGLDTGLSAGLSIVPVITGSSISAARLSDALFKRGINVQPIIYPAVPEKSARLRFFVSSEHTREQIARTVEILARKAGGYFPRRSTWPRSRSSWPD
jgi:8-amino-7-oxononanoate synthase